jgi:hypothetical protein
MLQWLLPALMPSWRFFDTMGAAPRLEWARHEPGVEPRWQAFRPQPAQRHPAAVALSLIWAPRRNETLFILSCAESLLQAPTAARERLLLSTLRAAALAGECPGQARETWLHVRIMITQRDGHVIHQLEAWRAEPLTLDAGR